MNQSFSRYQGKRYTDGKKRLFRKVSNFFGSLRTMISLVVLLPKPGNGRQSRKDNNIFHSAIKKEDLLLPLTEVM